MIVKPGKGIFFCAVFALVLGACPGVPVAVLPYQEDILVANAAPIVLGELDVGIVRLFSGQVELARASVMYHPRTDAVTLELRQEAPCRQYWSRRMRGAFINALARYEADYTARNLPRHNADETGQAYGAMKGKIVWYGPEAAREYEGFPVFELGYRFEQEKPYFTVLQRGAKDERETDVSRQVSCGRTLLYFTRAMARELAAFFDDEFLDQLLPESFRGDGGAALPEAGAE